MRRNVVALREINLLQSKTMYPTQNKVSFRYKKITRKYFQLSSDRRQPQTGYQKDRRTKGVKTGKNYVKFN